MKENMRIDNFTKHELLIFMGDAGDEEPRETFTLKPQEQKNVDISTITRIAINDIATERGKENE